MWGQPPPLHKGCQKSTKSRGSPASVQWNSWADKWGEYHTMLPCHFWLRTQKWCCYITRKSSNPPDFYSFYHRVTEKSWSITQYCEHHFWKLYHGVTQCHFTIFLSPLLPIFSIRLAIMNLTHSLFIIMHPAAGLFSTGKACLKNCMESITFNQRWLEIMKRCDA